jgi:hypothetical protein
MFFPTLVVEKTMVDDEARLDKGKPFNMKKYLLISIIGALLFTCKDEEIFEKNGERYLPLQVGNYWELEPPIPNYGFHTKIEILGTTTIDGKEYFEFKKVMKEAQFPADSVVFYLRMDNNAFVFRNDNGADVNIYRLAARDGYVWKHGDSNVTVRKHTIKLQTQDVTDCKTFYYDHPDYVDEEHYTSFAPEIGFIEEHYTFGRIATLTYARINGVEHHFKK